jgi:nicotinamidase-related amidase
MPRVANKRNTSVTSPRQAGNTGLFLTVFRLGSLLGDMLRSALCGAIFALALAASPALAQQVPAVPAPVAVSLDPSTTALLVEDITTQTCGSQPRCQQFLPRVASLLSNARAAGVYVLYTTPATQPPILPEVTPADGDPVFAGLGQDRFFDTALDEMLRARGIQNLVLVGWRENGSVLYTAVGANLRTYAVVVADDGTSAATDADVAIGRYQLLTQLNANANNEPLKKGAVTLSRTDLISFQ